MSAKHRTMATVSAAPRTPPSAQFTSHASWASDREEIELANLIIYFEYLNKGRSRRVKQAAQTYVASSCISGQNLLNLWANSVLVVLDTFILRCQLYISHNTKITKKKRSTLALQPLTAWLRLSQIVSLYFFEHFKAKLTDRSWYSYRYQQNFFIDPSLCTYKLK